MTNFLHSDWLPIISDVCHMSQLLIVILDVVPSLFSLNMMSYSGEFKGCVTYFRNNSLVFSRFFTYFSASTLEITIAYSFTFLTFPFFSTSRVFADGI